MRVGGRVLAALYEQAWPKMDAWSRSSEVHAEEPPVTPLQYLVLQSALLPGEHGTLSLESLALGLLHLLALIALPLSRLGLGDTLLIRMVLSD